MATTSDARTGVARSERFRWTREQYYAIAELGFFADKRVELIQGEILKLTTDPPHSVAMENVGQVLYAMLSPAYRIRIQAPVDLGRHDQPEPDVALLVREGQIPLAHPTTAVLLIEVSDSTLRKDRNIKAHLYARAGVPDYWIINLVDRQLEVRRRPEADPGRRGRFRYAEVTVVPEGGRMAPLAAPGSLIAVADLLPPG